MFDIPYAVSSTLYSGITDRIKHLAMLHDKQAWSDLDSHLYIELEETVQWYREHCVLGSKYLIDDFNKLKLAVDTPEYFHYNLYTHHRFTVKYRLVGDQTRVEYNQLLDRQDQLKQVADIELDKIIKYKGMYFRIIEVFEKLDDKHGRFIADSLTVAELMKRKRDSYES